MKKSLVIISLFLLFSCNEKIDVKENEVLLTVVDQKADQLLLSGQHILPKGTKGVYYGVGKEKMTFDFDFLFKDDAVGHIQFELTFAPRIDRLIDFFNEYKSDAFSDVVKVELRRMLRTLLQKYSKGDLSLAEVQKLVSTKIESSDGILRYVALRNLSQIIVTL